MQPKVTPTQEAISTQDSQTLDQLKSNFITEMSHEIRTPLSIILLSAELLENCTYQCSDEQKRAYIQRIQDAAKRINQVFNEALRAIETDTLSESGSAAQDT